MLSAAPVSLAGCQYWPHEGLFNECLSDRLPEKLRTHELVQQVWEGIDADQVWDCHCHLIGVGDNASGIWVNPNMQSLWHPIQYTQFKFYLSASCAADAKSVDKAVVARLDQLHQDMPVGYRSMLLAFDYYHGEQGEQNLEYSPFHVPNDYAHTIATNHANHFEWIASIHPYRKDAVERLEKAVKQNARAVKWLPSAMGIDASSPRCDDFYRALAEHNIPVLTHAGDEHAVDVPTGQTYNNPLLFRRALEHGVKVIFAHFATLGDSVDIDKGKHGPRVANIELFARLMDETDYEKQIYGDISAITQVNRDREMIEKIIENDQWHDRLLYGSDYPLPGVLPVFSPQNFVDWGMLSASQADVLSAVRRYNPLLFDVMLKRLIKVKGKRLSQRVFETRRHFVASSL